MCVGCVMYALHCAVSSSSCRSAAFPHVWDGPVRCVQVDAYLQELPDAVKLLQKKFPERVTVLSSGDEPEAVAAAVV
jgi:hypothetical protein